MLVLGKINLAVAELAQFPLLLRHISWKQYHINQNYKHKAKTINSVLQTSSY